MRRMEPARRRGRDTRLRTIAGPLILCSLFTLAFCVFYGGANYFAASSSRRYHVHLPFETELPFVPAASAVYLSIQILFLVPLIQFRSVERLLPLFSAMLFELVTASIVFVAAPVELGFAPLQDAGTWTPVDRVADLLNLDFNALPSWHVAFSMTIAAAVGRELPGVPRILLGAWAALIACSTVFAHQHHLADVVAGVVLSALTMKFVYEPSELQSRRGI